MPKPTSSPSAGLATTATTPPTADAATATAAVTESSNLGSDFNPELELLLSKLYQVIGRLQGIRESSEAFQSELERAAGLDEGAMSREFDRARACLGSAQVRLMEAASHVRGVPIPPTGSELEDRTGALADVIETWHRVDVLQVRWATQMAPPGRAQIGFVLYRNKPEGRVKGVVGTALGIDEQFDAYYVAARGAKLSPEACQAIFTHEARDEVR